MRDLPGQMGYLWRTMSRSDNFGGAWTQHKLGCLRSYLVAYATAMKKQSFVKAYIDAFAGTGESHFKEKPGDPDGCPMFDALGIDQKPVGIEQGSARIALEVEPPFDKYIYIEKSPERAMALQRLKLDFPSRSEKIVIHVGEANEELSRICRPGTNWAGHRAVLFLDPFGMEVDWKTIECVAKTQAIDLLLLFPIGMGVMRLLRNDGNINQANAEALTRAFGCSTWAERFYAKGGFYEPFLGGEPEEIKYKTATYKVIIEFLLERLQDVFPHVATSGRILCNSRNVPLYLLCFAAGNPGTGGALAVRMMNSIFSKSARTNHQQPWQ